MWPHRRWNVIWQGSVAQHPLPPYQGGGEMIAEVTFEKTTYADLPHKFEAGTPNIAGGIAFGAALDYMNGIGFEAIAQYEAELLAYATQALKSIDGLKIYGEAQEKTAVISFNVKGFTPMTWAVSWIKWALLFEQGITVRNPSWTIITFQEPFVLPSRFTILQPK